ncbi:serine--tRNA ligase [Candidatus Woesearchaeota archaeon]|nr:serine--tRNA ligase [Candidatus Woesearchaeota archaeon]
MLDIRFIRENPDAVRENMKKKFREDTHIVDEVLKKDEEYRALLQQAEKLRADRNQINVNINKTKKSGGDITVLLQQAKEIPQRIKEIEDRQNALKDEVTATLKKIPNILHESVPIGRDDKENVVRAVYGEPPKFAFPVKSHVEIAEHLGIVDFDASARVSGNGFFYLLGDLALLNQALIRFAMDFMMNRGFKLVEPPLMTRERIPAGCIDLAAFQQAVYRIEGEDLCLIATSEFPLVGMFVDQVIDRKKLPIKLVGFSQCFRKEVGAHGIDEKGLFRTHQFNKVEQVIICEPEDSYRHFEELQNISIEIFRELGLPTRVFESCSGDLGDLKAKGADLEAWSPRKDGYIEVCSVSNLTDNQARRLNIKVDDGKERYFPHTLNNTAIATSRAMVAILENYQNEDGTVTVPPALVPYMNNKARIESAK